MSRYFGRRWQRDWSVFRHKIVVLSRQVLRNVLLLYHYPRTFSLIRYFEDHCFVVVFPRARHLYVVQVLFLCLCCFWGKKGKSLTFNRRQIHPWRPHLRQSILFLIFSPELSRYLYRWPWRCKSGCKSATAPNTVEKQRCTEKIPLVLNVYSFKTFRVFMETRIWQENVRNFDVMNSVNQWYACVARVYVYRLWTSGKLHYTYIPLLLRGALFKFAWSMYFSSLSEKWSLVIFYYILPSRKFATCSSKFAPFFYTELYEHFRAGNYVILTLFLCKIFLYFYIKD